MDEKYLAFKVRASNESESIISFHPFLVNVALLKAAMILNPSPPFDFGQHILSHETQYTILSVPFSPH